MNRNAVFLMSAIVSLATVPVILWFATNAIPPRAIIQTEEHGNRMGPWVFTWGLVWVAVAAALLVALVCYVSAAASREVDAAPLR